MALALGETLPVIGKLLGHNNEATERIAASIATDIL